MNHQRVTWLACLLLLLALGCSKQPESNLIKVSGVVHVGDQAAAGVVVGLHLQAAPTSETFSAVALSQGVTDEQGKFDISTHTQGDGAPPGKHAVTFTWGQFDAMTRSMSGDRLNGRYATPEKSEIRWTIDGPESKDFGIIQLSTADSR